jgi:hypothetical protein
LNKIVFLLLFFGLKALLPHANDARLCCISLRFFQVLTLGKLKLFMVVLFLRSSQFLLLSQLPQNLTLNKNCSRVPLTARRITGRSDNRPFFCPVSEALSDLISGHFGWITSWAVIGEASLRILKNHLAVG